MTLWPGSIYPLGATHDGTGVNFAVYSEAAERIELCLFAEDGTETRHPLPEITRFVHHGYAPGLSPGQRYGFRVHGPWDPARGLLCNPAKLLVDPYAKAIEGDITWGPEVYGHRPGEVDAIDTRDSAPFMPKAVVIDPTFDWGDDAPPAIPLHKTVIYETHVRGISVTHPEVPDELRGTYAGMVTDPVLKHLQQLGVTAVELMPVHHFVTEHSVEERGLTNYWGYNTLAFLAPHGPYSSVGDSGGQVHEFKAMVKRFHEAGIEVILDVVYNHTAEGNHLGPLLSLKGFDNQTYYRLDPADPHHYVDFSGTGNSLDMRFAQTLQLMMDSLRYWILDMHVDGFRFDLASALARGLHDVDRLSSFFDLIHQDPVINGVKLIAEPWDVGAGGYQVGNFPPLWSEWNGKYRDGVRDFWRSHDETLADFATRFTGSSDLYATSGRRPSASINFITAHDGFTLADLVAYEHKHNEANGEDNQDGETHNRSWNSGHEGPTDDADIVHVRETRRRSLFATLMLSQGVPMISGGDEIGRTQGGNNNGYAQDNGVCWYDWNAVDHDFLDFARQTIELRRTHPIFRRRRWLEGRPLHGTDVEDIVWFAPDGTKMTEDDWDVGYASSLTVFLNGRGIAAPGPRGERITDDSFLVLLNAYGEQMDFVIPAVGGDDWMVELHTACDDAVSRRVTAHGSLVVDGWATVVLRQRPHRRVRSCDPSRRPGRSDLRARGCASSRRYRDPGGPPRLWRARVVGPVRDRDRPVGVARQRSDPPRPPCRSWRAHTRRRARNRTRAPLRRCVGRGLAGQRRSLHGLFRGGGRTGLSRSTRRPPPERLAHLGRRRHAPGAGPYSPHDPYDRLSGHRRPGVARSAARRHRAVRLVRGNQSARRRHQPRRPRHRGQPQLRPRDPHARGRHGTRRPSRGAR
jgi:glycogen operon protein